MNLQDYRVLSTEPNIFYIPNFITKQEEEYLINQVNTAPLPKWKQLSHRRLQNWGGLPSPKGMIPENIPNWLQNYMDKVASLGMFNDKKPNHVLINEYLPGQGIMPHEDGPLYYPTVTTISLGSHTLLDFYYHRKSGENTDEVGENPESQKKFTSLLLEPRSLVVVQDDMYEKHLHGIREIEEDIIDEEISNVKSTESTIGDVLKRSTRISLTIRHVPKVLKAKLFFNKK